LHISLKTSLATENQSVTRFMIDWTWNSRRQSILSLIYDKCFHFFDM